jgi:hypothetical protein
MEHSIGFFYKQIDLIYFVYIEKVHSLDSDKEARLTIEMVFQLCQPGNCLATLPVLTPSCGNTSKMLRIKVFDYTHRFLTLIIYIIQFEIRITFKKVNI